MSKSNVARPRCVLGRDEMQKPRLLIVGAWIQAMSYWVPARVRAIEGVSIERVKTALPLVRLERGDIRYAHAQCHGTSRERMMSILKHGLIPHGRQCCMYVLRVPSMRPTDWRRTNNWVTPLGMQLCTSHHGWRLKVARVPDVRLGCVIRVLYLFQESFQMAMLL